MVQSGEWPAPSHSIDLQFLLCNSGTFQVRFGLWDIFQRIRARVLWLSRTLSIVTRLDTSLTHAQTPNVEFSLDAARGGSRLRACARRRRRRLAVASRLSRPRRATRPRPPTASSARSTRTRLAGERRARVPIPSSRLFVLASWRPRQADSGDLCFVLRSLRYVSSLRFGRIAEFKRIARVPRGVPERSRSS